MRERARLQSQTVDHREKRRRDMAAQNAVYMDEVNHGASTRYQVTDQHGASTRYQVTDQHGALTRYQVTDQHGASTRDQVTDQHGASTRAQVTDQNANSKDNTVTQHSEGDLRMSQGHGDFPPSGHPRCPDRPPGPVVHRQPVGGFNVFVTSNVKSKNSSDKPDTVSKQRLYSVADSPRTNTQSENKGHSNKSFQHEQDDKRYTVNKPASQADQSDKVAKTKRDDSNVHAIPSTSSAVYAEKDTFPSGVVYAEKDTLPSGAVYAENDTFHSGAVYAEKDTFGEDDHQSRSSKYLQSDSDFSVDSSDVPSNTEDEAPYTHSNRHHSDNHHANRQHSDRDRHHSDSQHSDRHHSDRQHSDRQHSDRHHSDRQHSDRHHANRQHSDNHHANRQHSDRDRHHSDSQHSDHHKRKQKTKHRKKRSYNKPRADESDLETSSRDISRLRITEAEVHEGGEDDVHDSVVHKGGGDGEGVEQVSGVGKNEVRVQLALSDLTKKLQDIATERKMGKTLPTLNHDEETTSARDKVLSKSARLPDGDSARKDKKYKKHKPEGQKGKHHKRSEDDHLSTDLDVTADSGLDNSFVKERGVPKLPPLDSGGTRKYKNRNKDKDRSVGHSSRERRESDSGPSSDRSTRQRRLSGSSPLETRDSMEGSLPRTRGNFMTADETPSRHRRVSVGSTDNVKSGDLPGQSNKGTHVIRVNSEEAIENALKLSDKPEESRRRPPRRYSITVGEAPSQQRRRNSVGSLELSVNTPEDVVSNKATPRTVTAPNSHDGADDDSNSQDIKERLSSRRNSISKHTGSKEATNSRRNSSTKHPDETEGFKSRRDSVTKRSKLRNDDYDQDTSKASDRKILCYLKDDVATNGGHDTEGCDLDVSQNGFSRSRSGSFAWGDDSNSGNTTRGDLKHLHAQSNSKNNRAHNIDTNNTILLDDLEGTEGIEI